MHKRTTAPMIAVMRDPVKPVLDSPTRLKMKPTNHLDGECLIT